MGLHAFRKSQNQLGPFRASARHFLAGPPTCPTRLKRGHERHVAVHFSTIARVTRGGPASKNMAEPMMAASDRNLAGMIGMISARPAARARCRDLGTEIQPMKDGDDLAAWRAVSGRAEGVAAGA